MDVIAYHGDRRGDYTFDKRRIRGRDDGIRGFYFAPENRRRIAEMYTSHNNEDAHKYVLHIKNPIYEERPRNGRYLTPDECAGHDALIAVSDGSPFPREQLGKGDVIEIVVFDKSIIEELTD